MNTKLGVHQIGQLSNLQRKRRIREFTGHLTMSKPSQITTIRARGTIGIGLCQIRKRFSIDNPWPDLQHCAFRILLCAMMSLLDGGHFILCSNNMWCAHESLFEQHTTSQLSIIFFSSPSGNKTSFFREEERQRRVMLRINRVSFCIWLFFSNQVRRRCSLLKSSACHSPKTEYGDTSPLQCFQLYSRTGWSGKSFSFTITNATCILEMIFLNHRNGHRHTFLLFVHSKYNGQQHEHDWVPLPFPRLVCATRKDS